MTTPPKNDFDQAAREREPGLIVEFWQFLRHNRKWWLVPLLIALALVGAVVLLSGTAAAPFIYPLF